MHKFKKIEDEQFIKNLFRNLARTNKEIAVTVDYDSKLTDATMSFVDKRGTEPYLKFSESLPCQFDSFEVLLQFNEVSLLFNTEIQSTSGNVMYIKKPSAIYLPLRRLVHRYKLRQNDLILITFEGTITDYEVIDISTKGLGFISNSEFLPKTDPFSIRINLPGYTVIKVSGLVRYRRAWENKYVYGLEFEDLDWDSYNCILNYLFERTYPNLNSLCDLSYTDIYNLFKDSGYLSLKSRSEMDKNFESMTTTLDNLKGRKDVSINLAFCTEDKVLTSGSVLRIYNHTFLGQHLATIPKARFNLKAITSIYYGMPDSLIGHPYFSHYLTYFNANLTWHKEMYKRIGDYIDDQDKFIFDTIEFFECNVKDLRQDSDETWLCERLYEPDEFIAFCVKHLKPLETRCYSYNASFYLDKIRKLYKEIGLKVNRGLWKITASNQVKAFMVAEAFSEGLNLYNLLDMCRIYFVEESFIEEGLIGAALITAASFFTENSKDKFNVIFKASHEIVNRIDVPGLTYSHLLGRVMTNCKGGSEYKKLLMVNFHG